MQLDARAALAFVALVAACSSDDESGSPSGARPGTRGGRCLPKGGCDLRLECRNGICGDVLDGGGQGGTGATGGVSGTGGAAAAAAASGSGGSSGASGGSAGSTGGSSGTAGAAGCSDAGVIGVEGVVTTNAQPPAAIANARVTMSGAGGAFRETRSDAAGRFAIPGVAAGTYTIGAAARGLEYSERTVNVANGCATENFALGPEAHRGSWQTLGDPGTPFGGTNSGVLLPDGRLMFCHDTLDPVIFNPVNNQKAQPPASPRLQGCHAVNVMPNGLVIYVGGHDQPVYGPGTRQVKTFDPVQNAWQVRANLNDYRWYPSMVPLPNGELLAVGGGGLNNPVRVSTSEVMNPTTLTWTPAGNISIGNEVSPIVLLFTGEALMTHRPPQLFNPGTGQWRAAADFVQQNRMSNGDHADHEMALLPDGRVVAIGFKTFSSGNWGNLVEIYDPTRNAWKLGANFAPVRSRASIIQLPDGRILVLGGNKDQTSDPTPVNAYNYMALADLYDPARDSWRRLQPMSLAREYHAMPILVPDGRVIIAGGEGEPGNEPPASTIEAFSPPYLFRGPRPEISELSSTTLRRGNSLSFRIGKTNAPTQVLLVGATASTHFMDSGPGRVLDLNFTQAGDRVTANIPIASERAVYGWYILFAMVDDVPSAGLMVRIAP